MPLNVEGTREAYIRAAMLGGFAELAAAGGASPEGMLRRANITPRALVERDMLISWQAIGDLMELAAVDLANPSLGLAWALAVPSPFLNFGPLGLLARFSGTIGEWCAVSRNYWRFHTNAYSVSLLESGSGETMSLRFSVDALVPPSRHQMEHTIAGVCRFMRVLAPIDDSQFVCIRFRHFRPRDTTLHEQTFRCPVEFECEHDELVYRKEVDACPIEFQFDDFPNLIAHYVAARSGLGPEAGLPTKAIVEAVIPCLIATGFCTLAHVAELLNIGPKTLQRQLAREGTNFAQIVDRERQRIARQILVESEAPMASIAGLLGYARTAPFTFAFKRWTGLAPRDYRRRMRHNVAGEG